MRRLPTLAVAAAMLLPASTDARAQAPARLPAAPAAASAPAVPKADAPKAALPKAALPKAASGKAAAPKSAASPSAAAPKREQNVCERELARAAGKYDIPLQILYAVGLTESGVNGRLEPLMLYIEGKDYLPANLSEALKMFRAANDRGVQLIDIGCMQVNYYWHKHEFRSLEEIFDPRLNVEQAARFLKVLKQRHGSWTMAVARYNAGPKNTVGQHRYVCRVMKNLVAAGVGQWTGQSRAFCEAPPVPAQPPAAPAPAAPAVAAQAPAAGLY